LVLGDALPGAISRQPNAGIAATIVLNWVVQEADHPHTQSVDVSSPDEDG
jgi:hypothetical protein